MGDTLFNGFLLDTAQTGLNVGSKIFQSNATADTERANAVLSDIQAKDAIDRGDAEADRYLRSVSRLVGEQRSAFAGGGVDLSIGSPAKVLSDTEALGALDALMIKQGANREALGYRTAASQSRAAAALEESKKAAAVGSGVLTGGLRYLQYRKERGY